jgi:hypothetical protein
MLSGLLSVERSRSEVLHSYGTGQKDGRWGARERSGGVW